MFLIDTKSFLDLEREPPINRITPRKKIITQTIKGALEGLDSYKPVSYIKKLTISIVLFLGTFDEQKNTMVYRNEFFGFKPSRVSVYTHVSVF